MKGGYKCSGNSDHKLAILAGGLVESQTEMVVALEHDFEREESCDTVLRGYTQCGAPRARLAQCVSSSGRRWRLDGAVIDMYQIKYERV